MTLSAAGSIAHSILKKGKNLAGFTSISHLKASTELSHQKDLFLVILTVLVSVTHKVI